MSDNAAQIEYWNGPVGERWARLQEAIDGNLAEITKALLPFAAPKPGERVLEIGCGAGTITLKLAAAVGAAGAVTAVDISGPMLAVARARAKAQGAHIDFQEADASQASFRAEFDLVISRFGVMFFADPLSAFANIRKALKPNGRMRFVCWRAFAENPWSFAPFEAARYLVPPQPPADPLAPGPFAFANSGRLRNILDEAGFIDIRIEPLDSVMRLGATAEEAGAQMLNIGPLAKAATGLDDSVREEIRRVAEKTLAKFKTANGIAPPAACWLVGASA